MGNCASGTKKTYNTTITGVNSVNDEQQGTYRHLVLVIQPDNSPPLPHEDVTYASIYHSGSKPAMPRATVETDCDYATVCVPRPPDSDQSCRDGSLDSLESDQSSKDCPLQHPESDKPCKEPPDSEQTRGEDSAADQYICIY
ncbi:unnamed protein product [Knipowitschia caucasica]|uniref:Uncharacterized protein n=1 Tax=Knipowitschia caucasica TaxID=637954 RepID=A0AAV2K115_KNICA